MKEEKKRRNYKERKTFFLINSITNALQTPLLQQQTSTKVFEDTKDTLAQASLFCS